MLSMKPPDNTTTKNNFYFGEYPSWKCITFVPQAVCCDDHVHCCPQGTTCNLVSDTCDSSGSSVSLRLFRKTPTLSFTPQIPPLGREEVLCDPTHRCPGLKTCCRNQQGGWSCCPLVQVRAVYQSDGSKRPRSHQASSNSNRGDGHSATITAWSI